MSRYSFTKLFYALAVLVLITALPAKANKMATYAEGLTAVTGGVSARIVGGSTTSSDRLPFMLALYTGNNPNNANFICGASLIGEYWAMTAAHCVINSINGAALRADRLFIRAGVTELSSTEGRLIEVVANIPHPDYNDGGTASNFNNDIALLELAEPVMEIPLVIPALPVTDHFPGNGETGIIAGWGATAQNGAESDTLRQVEVDTVSHIRCYPLYSTSLKLESKFCAGGLPEGGICLLYTSPSPRD